MKIVWTNSPYTTYSSFEFFFYSDKEKIKNDFEEIENILQSANNNLDNEVLKNIFFKNNTAYWWENYLQVIDALKNNENWENGFFEFSGFINSHQKIFTQYFFKGLIIQIKGWTRYSLKELKGYGFFRLNYMNELFRRSGFYSLFNTKQENIYQFGLNLKVLYDIWNVKIFFKYNREMKILLLSYILIKNNCFSLLPNILYHMQNHKISFDNAINFLKKIIK